MPDEDKPKDHGVHPWSGTNYARALARYEMDDINTRKRLILLRLVESDDVAEVNKHVWDKHS